MPTTVCFWSKASTPTYHPSSVALVPPVFYDSEHRFGVHTTDIDAAMVCLDRETKKPIFQHIVMDDTQNYSDKLIHAAPASRRPHRLQGAETPAIPSFHVARIENENWTFHYPAMFDIIVVPWESSVDKCELWTTAAATNMKNMNQLSEKTIAWTARPGSHIFFFCKDKTKSWEQYDKAVVALSSGIIVNKDIRRFSSPTDLWHAIVDVVASRWRAEVAQGAPDAAHWLVPQPTRVVHARKQDQQQQQSVVAAAAASATSFPLSWQATPTIVVLHKNGNRGTRYVCLCLEGVVTEKSMTFEPLLFPSKGTLVQLAEANDATTATTTKGRNRGGGEDRSDTENVGQRFPITAGMVFTCKLVTPLHCACLPDEVDGKDHNLSGNQRVKTIDGGSILRALPWVQQQQKSEIWRQVRTSFPLQINNEASSKKSNIINAPLEAAPNYIFRQPSSVVHLTYLKVKLIFPNAAEKKAFVHDFLTSATTTKQQFAVHINTGTCGEHHLTGLAESPPVAPSTAAHQASFDPEVDDVVFGIYNNSNSSDPPSVSIFLGGDSIVQEQQPIELKSNRGQTVTRMMRPCCRVNTMAAATGGSSSSSPFHISVIIRQSGGGTTSTLYITVAEVLQVRSFEDVMPSQYFFGDDDGASTTATTTATVMRSFGNPDAKTTSAPPGNYRSIVTPKEALSHSSPSSIMIQPPSSSSSSSSRSGASLREARAAAVMSMPQFSDDAMHENYDEQMFAYLLLGRNVCMLDDFLSNKTMALTTGTNKQPRDFPQLYHARLVAASSAFAAAVKGIPQQDPNPDRTEIGHIRPLIETATTPSLLEWALGCWLPPFPSDLLPPDMKRSAGRTSSGAIRNMHNRRKGAVQVVLKMVSEMLRSDARIFNSNNHNNNSGSISMLNKLVQTVFRVVIECDFTEQVSGGSGTMRRTPIALCQRGFFSFLTFENIPRGMVTDLSQPRVLGDIIAFATSAAATGNVGLVTVVVEMVVRAAVGQARCGGGGGGCGGGTTAAAGAGRGCSENDATVVVDPYEKASSNLPLFPAAGMEKELAQPAVRFVPPRDADARKAHLQQINAIKKSQKCNSLDSIVAALCTNLDVVKMKCFPQLLAHAAFGQMRINLQTDRLRAGSLTFVVQNNATMSSMAPTNSFVSRQIHQNEANRKKWCDENAFLTSEQRANVRLVRSVGPLIGHSMHWMHRHNRLWLVQAPVSTAVVVAFLHQAMRPALLRGGARVVASSGEFLCDAVASAITAYVASFLMDLS